MLKDYFNDSDEVFSIHEALRDEILEAAAETMGACGCKPADCRKKTALDNPEINSLPLAMAYVPMQKFECLHTPEDALSAGTLFKKLDLPFLGGSLGGCKHE